MEQLLLQQKAHSRKTATSVIIKNYKLELVRGTAAFFVFLNHLLGNQPILQQRGGLLLNFFGNWGVEAVMIFFMLSGIVINMSQSFNPKNASSFIRNRLLRVYPLCFAG